MSNIIIYNTQDGETSVSLLAKDGMVWMSQMQIAELFATTKQNISLHIQNILKEKELEQNSVVKEYLTAANDGKNYSVTHYSLEMILAIGFRVRSKRGTQFRQWANKNLKEYMIKGFVIDDERLKNPDGKPAQTQNKLLFAITGQTAAEIIINRADDNKPNMALTSFKGSKVRKEDIYIAKNYLTSDELDSLNRFVIVFLETAELRAKNKEDITMDFWRENIDKIIEFNDKEVLKNNGTISYEQMKEMVEKVYKTFDNKRKKQEAIEADYIDLEELKKIENLAKSKKS